MVLSNSKMHSYSNTDFPGLPVIQFLIIICIESNSINSTVRNRLLLQSIHFRKDLLETEAFHSLVRLHKTSRNFILLILLKKPREFFRFYNTRDSPTRRIILLLEIFNSFILHAVHICVCFKTFQGNPDILQGSTLIQHSSIRMHIPPLAGFQKTPQSTS